MFARNYARYFDLFNQDKPYRKEIEFVYKWAEKPKSIFDIGAGTGIYWKYYPEGTEIMGVEKSREMAGKGKQIICTDITKYKHLGRFDCATALFDVLNYIPEHDWWKNIPVDKGGYFIFDIWDKEKVDREGFRETFKRIGTASRHIIPLGYDGKSVLLKIEVQDGSFSFTEEHKMYVHSDEDIRKFCGKEFEVVDIKETSSWQKWYKCKKK